MNNASDALKIAAALIVFVVAISMLFSLIATIRNTADSVLFYSDQTNFYEWDSGKSNGKIVGENKVISSLYSQKENLTYVYIQDGSQQIYPTDSYSNLEDFIKDKLSDGSTYIETVVEIIVSGKHIYADDGTMISPTPGDSRTYIYYTKQ